jgi:hypothetical protein
MPPVLGLRTTSQTVSSPFLGYVAALKVVCGENRSALPPVGLDTRLEKAT